MTGSQTIIENQFFIGVPWKDIRPKFEKVISALRDEYPVHCVIFGRNTGQDAKDLWHSIQQAIEGSAATIFDVTASNPNVAMEFGYAEALGKQRVLTRYERKPRKKGTSGSGSRVSASIISDLAGKIRVPYKNNNALARALKAEFDRNPYVVRFNRTFRSKRKKKVAVGVVHQLDGGRRIKKPDLVLSVETQFPNITTVDVPALIDEMNKAKLLVVKRGKHGGVTIPRI